MIRFLIDQFRQAPGPFKSSRLLIADLSEEIIDLAKQYLNDDEQNIEFIPEEQVTNITSITDTDTDKKIETKDPDKKNKKKTVSKTRTRNKQSAAFKKAIRDPKNQRKQQFKTLAILFETYNNNQEALSGKELSKFGEKYLQLKISPENIRKVIRFKLSEYVDIETVGKGTHTAFKYKLTDNGINFFTSTYLL